MKKINSSREVAFLSLIHSLEGGFIETFFKENSFCLSKKDLNLAKQIAFGTIKRILSLEYLLNSIAKKNNIKKLNLKKIEKMLLYTAIFQYFFMDRIPLFAIVNETVSLAKKYFRKEKAPFFNYILRLLDKTELHLPNKKDVLSLSQFYSYPPFFIKELLKDYKKMDQVEEILDLQNGIFPSHVRLRGSDIPDECRIIHDGKFKVGEIKEGSLSFFCGKKDFYIQNITPVLLLEFLLDSTVNPKKILDLCAAPGGKTVALFDAFPNANFYVNDISESRINVLKENLKIHEIEAEIYLQRAEQMDFDEKFDLVILDLPCSNSGVLSKRHEARWRLSEESLIELEKLQLDIFKNSIKALSSSGYIFFMTCSILKRENEYLINKALKLSKDLELVKSLTILPDRSGKDGGFAALIKKKS